MAGAGLPRTFFDFRDMLKSYAAGGYPYTPAVGLISGLATAIQMLEDEGLDAVYARHAGWQKGCGRAVRPGACGLVRCRLELYSDTVTAVVVPAGCNGTDLVKLAPRNMASPLAWAWARWRARVVFRIGHLGMLTDVMMLSGLATAEMCMADLGWPITLGSGGGGGAGNSIGGRLGRWRWRPSEGAGLGASPQTPGIFADRK